MAKEQTNQISIRREVNEDHARILDEVDSRRGTIQAASWLINFLHEMLGLKNTPKNGNCQVGNCQNRQNS